MKVYLRTSNPCVISPTEDEDEDVDDDGSDDWATNTYSCSLATNFRMHPIMPSTTGSRFANPVMLPVPPRNTGSRNVMRENKPCCEREEIDEKRKNRKYNYTQMKYSQLKCGKNTHRRKCYFIFHFSLYHQVIMLLYTF